MCNANSLVQGLNPSHRVYFTRQYPLRNKNFVYICMYIYIYLYIYICVCVCVCVCVCHGFRDSDTFSLLVTGMREDQTSYERRLRNKSKIREESVPTSLKSSSARGICYPFFPDSMVSETEWSE